MSVLVRNLGLQDYLPLLEQMQTYTLTRDKDSSDQIWQLQHPPVYTQGLNGKPEHLIRANNIPVIKTDRGGQVTYHGPGQAISYVLIDIQRLGIGVNDFVNRLEQSVIDLLSDFELDGQRLQGAPGVYIDGKKIAALGLRIKHGRSYHGLSLNIDMDLSPFADINPCGYPELEVTQLKDLGVTEGIDEINQRLLRHLHFNLGYNSSAATRSKVKDKSHE